MLSEYNSKYRLRVNVLTDKNVYGRDGIAWIIIKYYNKYIYYILVLIFYAVK